MHPSDEGFCDPSTYPDQGTDEKKKKTSTQASINTRAPSLVPRKKSGVSSVSRVA